MLSAAVVVLEGELELAVDSLSLPSNGIGLEHRVDEKLREDVKCLFKVGRVNVKVETGLLRVRVGIGVAAVHLKKVFQSIFVWILCRAHKHLQARRNSPKSSS